jgi:uroporphyrinogen decarboxylase
MDSRQRFLTALNGQIPDRVPIFDFPAQRELFETVIGRRPTSYNGRDVAQVSIALGLDAAWIPFGGYPGLEPDWIEPGVSYRDEWGVTYKIEPVSWPDDAPIVFPIASREDLGTLKCPDPTIPGRERDIREAQQVAQGRIAILGGVRGPFSQAWYLMGPQNLLIAFHDDPELVTSLFAVSNQYNLEAGRRQADAGVDAFFIFDDIGYKTAPFISLDHYHRLVLPFIQVLIDGLRKTGRRVIFHSDGKIHAFLQDMVDAGISGIHPLQRTAGMDLRQIKEEFGDRVCIVGNVDSSVTLPYGSVKDVEQEVKECIRIAGPGGGYVLASDHSLHDGIPVENIRAMIRSGREWGSYPLAVG